MKANTNVNILVIFGENIKFYRKKFNISQFDLAIEAEIDGKTLRMIENGKVDVHYATIIKILSGFQKKEKNITLEELLITKN